MNEQDSSQAFLSCTEVARRLGLSRQRFWQLRKDGVFPEPQLDENTGRPYYTEDQMAVCLDFRKRNVGLNGRVVLFYSARPMANVPKPARKKRRVQPKAVDPHLAIIDSLKGLGLTGISSEQVESAIMKIFPNGKDGVEHGELVRAIFLHIQRQNPGDNVGR